MPPLHRIRASLAFMLALGSGPCAAAAAGGPATDIYQYAGECVRLRDVVSNRYVVRDASGYALQTRASAATPFRMQATALGSYLLYGPDATMVAAGAPGHVAPDGTAGPLADWALTRGATALQFTNVATHQALSVDATNHLAQSGAASARRPFNSRTSPRTRPCR